MRFLEEILKISILIWNKKDLFILRNTKYVLTIQTNRQLE